MCVWVCLTQGGHPNTGRFAFGFKESHPKTWSPQKNTDNYQHGLASLWFSYPQTGYPKQHKHSLATRPKSWMIRSWENSRMNGSILSHQGTAGFRPCFHLPGFHFGYLILTHSHMNQIETKVKTPSPSGNLVHSFSQIVVFLLVSF